MNPNSALKEHVTSKVYPNNGSSLNRPFLVHLNNLFSICHFRNFSHLPFPILGPLRLISMYYLTLAPCTLASVCVWLMEGTDRRIKCTYLPDSFLQGCNFSSCIPLSRLKLLARSRFFRLNFFWVPIPFLFPSAYRW